MISIEEISIIINDDAHTLKENLLGMINSEIGEELGINIKYDSNVINLKFSNKDLKPLVTNAIAKIIIDNYEKKILNKVIHSNYYYFNLPEKRQILDHSLNYIATEHNHMMGNSQKKAKYYIQIDEFLKQS